MEKTVDSITIKPIGVIRSLYVRHFDVRDDVVSGWIDKHFLDTDRPEKTILK